MIILIAGASHTGKTVLAQKLLEKYKVTYLSIDHLKMGLIRSGKIDLTPESDDHKLTNYIWPIVREIIKTAIENDQNLIVEGCYIPFDWKNDFDDTYIKSIRYCCLIFSENYISNNYAIIKEHENDIENRVDDTSCTLELLIRRNAHNMEMCKRFGCDHLLIEDDYNKSIETLFCFNMIVTER